MELVSLNISKLKSVDYNSEEISTGIFKLPIDGEAFVQKTNIEGDAQADLKNHGGAEKAVYGFASDHYSHWRETFSKSELAHGVFGENLTILGLLEADIFIGDQFQLGSCVLEVSQPRVPCFKLGIALDNPKAVKLFTKTANTGVYFRVITEGTICKGDIVEKINEVTNSVSVRSLFRAYYDKSFEQAQVILERAVQLETLAPEWQNKIVHRLA